MGMFDYVRCELPLPLGQDWLYQTKDTREWCGMDEFIIQADGRLVNDENKEDQRFDGDLVFYPDVSITDNDDLRYRATFRDGCCVEICQLDDGRWKQVYKPEAR